MSHRSNVFARFREKAVANFRINQLASLCHQVAALVQDVFSNFYVMKDDKIPNNLTPTGTGKYKHQPVILRFFYLYSNEFNNNKAYLTKLFLVTYRLFMG